MQAKILKILVYHGTSSSDNLGDTAMLDGAVRELTKISPKNKLAVVTNPNARTNIWELNNVRFQQIKELEIKTPVDRLPKGSLRAAARKVTPSWLVRWWLGRDARHFLDVSDPRCDELREFCANFDALHIVGGGNLNDVFPHELFRRCALLLTFAEQGKPIVLTGQQLGPFFSSNSRRILERTLRLASFVGLRELGDSLTFCQVAKIRHHEVMGDDSFGLRPESDHIVSKILSRYGVRQGEFVALNLRIAPYAKLAPSLFKKAGALADEIINQTGKPLLIVPVALNEEDSDVSTGKQLSRFMRNSSKVAVVEDTYEITPALVKGILSKAFGAVGSSYHFCMFALSQGVPTVCINDGAYYSQKARGLAGFWQDGRIAMPLKNLDTPREKAQAIQGVLNESVFRKRLQARAALAKEYWENTYATRIGEIYRVEVAPNSIEQPEFSRRRKRETSH